MFLLLLSRRALQEVPRDTPYFWEAVSVAVETRDAAQCRRYEEGETPRGKPPAKRAKTAQQQQKGVCVCVCVCVCGVYVCVVYVCVLCMYVCCVYIYMCVCVCVCVCVDCLSVCVGASTEHECTCVCVCVCVYVCVDCLSARESARAECAYMYRVRLHTWCLCVVCTNCIVCVCVYVCVLTACAERVCTEY